MVDRRRHRRCGRRRDGLRARDAPSRGSGNAHFGARYSVLLAIRALLPAMPPGASGPLALSAPGVLAALLGRARLAVEEEDFLDTAYEYPDLETALRAIRSAGLTVLAERTAGQALVTTAITSALGPYRTASGGYRLAAESRCVKATA